jgi:hypothetical protein
MTIRFVADGVRYVVEFRELHHRTDEERSATLKPDAKLWRAGERDRAVNMRMDDGTEKGKWERRRKKRLTSR